MRKQLLGFLKKSVWLIAIINFCAISAQAQQAVSNKDLRNLGKERFSEKELQSMRENLIGSSEYVLKGWSRGSQKFYNDSAQKVWAISVFHVTEVLRGPSNLKGQTIYTLQEAFDRENWSVNGIYWQKQHYRFNQFYVKFEEGILFLKTNTQAILLDSIGLEQIKNTLILQAVDPNGVAIGKTSSVYNGKGKKIKPKGEYYGFFHMSFKDIDAVYKCLSEYPKIIVPIEN